jgi:putative oxidoreductase
MKSLISNQYLLFIFRIILSVVFIFAGIEKIIDPEGFSTSIANYKLLPLSLVNIAAITLPWIEVAAGLFLLFGVATKENTFLINSMLLIFIIAIGISVARGLNIDCGCFGTSSVKQVGFAKIAENSILFLMGIPLILFGSRLFSIAEPGSAENKESEKK